MSAYTRHPGRGGGFSLIEVLVSVVVLSFGLLSLASLQGALMKAGAESRSQSVALAMASEKLEFFAGYLDRAEFQALTDGSDDPVTVDGIAYARSWTVERYAYPDAGGDFVALASDTGATPSGYVDNNEFKRIEVTVQWTDSTGTTQAVALEGALAALSPLDTAKVAKVSSTGGARGPEIIIVNPATEEGVIPIAVGDGSDTAATNPKPEVAGSSTSQRVIETRFDVLTYAALAGDNALAQSRVETVVAGCTCDYGNAPSAAEGPAMRPTYWDGLRYVVPEEADYTPLAGPSASENIQSALCTACCRDHHDPAAVEGARFDPRNTSHAQHQLYNPASGALGTASNAGVYTEACRLIRVDGIFRVASDAYNDYMNLLATDNNPATTTSDYVPTDAATANYQNFVLEYLDGKFVKGSESTYNTVIAPDSAAVAGLEQSNSINAPEAPIEIDRPAISSGSSTLKWLHDRGLYIDYLEDEAIQAVNEAKDECEVSGTEEEEAADLRTCVLKVLPFTTINLTELANWTPQVGTQIVVANNDFRTALTSDVPIRGKVVPGSKPSHSTVTNAVAEIGLSNSGLAVLRGPIDTGDVAHWTDSQPFQPSGSWDTTEGGAGSGGTYTITLNNYAFTNSPPAFTVVPSATCNPADSGFTRPNPFICTSQQVGDPQVVTIGNYNYQDNGDSDADLYCSGSEGSKPYPGTYTTKTCYNFRVSAVTPSGTWTVANSGSTNETTTISFPVPTSSGFGITFEGPETTEMTPVCTYKNKGSNPNQFHVETPDCP